MPASSPATGRNFALLWLADTVNQFGTSLRTVAVPLTAVTILTVSPIQLGVLAAASTCAFLLIGLPAGAWVDRLPHRRLLWKANAVRALLMATIPLADWFGLLSYGQLVAVALLGGTMSVLVDIAASAMVPTVVSRERLRTANARMQTTQAAGRLAGPALAGPAAQLLGAANAVGVAAAGHLAAALLSTRLRITGAKPSPARHSLLAEVVQGIRYAFGDRSLRALTACGATYNLFFNVGAPMYVLFLVRELNLPMSQVGLMLTSAGIGGLAGAATSSWWARWLGEARSTVVVFCCSQPCLLLIPLADDGWSVALFPVGAAGAAYGVTAFNVLQTTFRQSTCPPDLYGRVTASSRFLTWGMIPIGGLIGGALGEVAGVRAALWVAAAGALLSTMWLVASPLRRGEKATPA
jgi:MFS family permease